MIDIQTYESLPEFQKGAELLKIQFVGSHGNGKSILVAGTEALLKKHGIVPVRPIRELSERLQDMGIELNENTTLDGQLAITHMQAAEEILLRERGKHQVTDRAIIDNFAYPLLAFSGKTEYFQSRILNEIERIVDLHLQYHPASHMFFVPTTNGELVADGTRSTEKSFQESADEKIQELLLQKRVHHYRLPEIPSKERNQWLSIVERTIFPDLPPESYLEHAPALKTWESYISLNPGITLAQEARATWRSLTDEEIGRIATYRFNKGGIGPKMLEEVRECIQETNDLGPVNTCFVAFMPGTELLYYQEDKKTREKIKIGYSLSTSEGERIFEPPIFRPYRIGAEDTEGAGVEVRCMKTYKLLDVLKLPEYA